MLSQTLPLDYPMILSTVTIVHIGTNIDNTVLAVGDSESSPHITLVSNVSLLRLVNSTQGVMYYMRCKFDMKKS